MKHFTTLATWIVLWISSISLVFWGFIANLQNITPSVLLSKNIFLDSKELNSTVIWFKHEGDIHSYNVHSNCKIATKYLGDADFSAYFQVTFVDASCRNPFIMLETDGKILDKSSIQLNLVSNTDLYASLIDLSDEQLSTLKENFLKKVSPSTVEITSLTVTAENTLKTQSIRKEYEFLYRINIINDILKKREEKYLIPISGFALPTEASKIPNAARPYRSDYTDGIHHAWDIDAKVWTPVIALDDGIVVRVVDDWNWGNLSNIRKGENLSREDMERNLDILRGNQVWIKTMKGEVVMYDHLETVASGLKEGQYVERGTTLWNVWITGVPDAEYQDAHLDFSVTVNPYEAGKAGRYEPEEYMYWDWKFKWKSREYILEHQYDIFERP